LQINYQLYSLIKEGLTNIQKHAQASWISICGQSTPQEIILKIEDNGRGFNVNAVNFGYGLLGMQERVDSLGGNFKISSAIERGTCILITIPL
jgi:signal transduction histidine kinase